MLPAQVVRDSPSSNCGRQLGAAAQRQHFDVGGSEQWGHRCGVGSRDLAATLGSRLKIPRLRWKYAWLKPLVGTKTAKNAQMLLPQLKASLFGAIRMLRR